MEEEGITQPRWIETLEAKYIRVPAVSVEDWEIYCKEQLADIPSCADSITELIDIFKPVVREIQRQTTTDWLARLKSILLKLNRQPSMRSVKVNDFVKSIDVLIDNLNFYAKIIELNNILVSEKLLIKNKPPFDINELLVEALKRKNSEEIKAINYIRFAEGSFERGYSELEAAMRRIDINLFDQQYYRPKKHKSFRAKYFETFDLDQKIRKEAASIFVKYSIPAHDANKALYLLSNSYLVLSKDAVRGMIYRGQKKKV